MEQSIDHQEILALTENGYTVTFEASGIGDYFCLLRRVATQELVNCTIGNSFGEALAGASEWDKSDRPGNGTASRPSVGEITRDLGDVKAYGRDTRRELLAIIGDLRTQLAEDVTYRLSRIEGALTQVQRQAGYLGLCVNSIEHPNQTHPHWDGSPRVARTHASNPYPAPGDLPGDH
jgi:hypothetical protein